MSGLSARLFLWRLALVGPLILAAPLAHAASRRYVLDPGTSQLTIHVGKTGALGFAGHEHEVVAGTFHGTATYDPDRIAQSSVDLSFEAGALRVSSKGEPSGDAPQVQAAMVGPACLDTHRFATVRFVSKKVTAGDTGPGGRDLVLSGDLTLHGVTHPLTIQVHVDVRGDTLQVNGTTTIRQSDFGITPISKAGVVKVKDELTVSWRIRGKAR